MQDFQLGDLILTSACEMFIGALGGNSDAASR